MNKKMKILVISAEVWRDDKNGGNVLSNLFRDFDCEFAQIFCNPGKPVNNICNKYYQMTDGMVLRNFLSHKPIGLSFEFSGINEDAGNSDRRKESAELPNKKFYRFFHKHRSRIFYSAKHILWNMSNWKNYRIQKFISDFDPDIIFAPCYGDRFMLRLTRFVGDLTGKKIISYISDDNYTLKQFSLSPLFWLNRFTVRREIRKTLPYYSLMYTMTEEQKIQFARDLNFDLKVLRKSASCTDIPEKQSVNHPIRIVYAGGIYLNRYKTLAKLVDSIKEVNSSQGVKIVLDIYTSNEITNKISNALDDKINSFIHPAVSLSELEQIYKRSDIALHTESFDLKNRLLVRTSFSTKIVDCLSSGCAVMAICDKKQAGYLYLKNNDAAICIDSPDMISVVLKKIVSDSDILLKYSEKARELCDRNHKRENNSLMLKDDFNRIYNECEQSTKQ